MTDIIISETHSETNSEISLNKKYKKFKTIINKTWYDIFDLIDKDIYEITEESYNELINSELSSIKMIFPIYKNIFNFTNYCIPQDIKVCIIGQDPYHGIYLNKKTYQSYPQAMGLSFSVPKECPLPPSLENIYSNMIKYGHMIKKPSHGNLEFWAYQGVLLLNTSLTVEKSKPNSHQSTWFEFTDELIKIISQKINNIVFVIWGSNAYDKIKLIHNKDNHRFIISSHPSPLSAHKPFKNYNSFVNTDHFGLVNQYLEEFNLINKDKLNFKKNEQICWAIY